MSGSRHAGTGLHVDAVAGHPGRRRVKSTCFPGGARLRTPAPGAAAGARTLALIGFCSAAIIRRGCAPTSGPRSSARAETLTTRWPVASNSRALASPASASPGAGPEHRVTPTPRVRSKPEYTPRWSATALAMRMLASSCRPTRTFSETMTETPPSRPPYSFSGSGGVWVKKTPHKVMRLSNVPKRVPNGHENGPRRGLRGPFYLVAGTGFEPATSGL